MQAIAVLYAYSQIDSVVSSLKNMRDNAELNFSRIFRDAAKIGKSLHGDAFELKQPRVTSRQVHRANIQSSSAEDYFRISIYNELVNYNSQFLKAMVLQVERTA